MTSDLDDLGVGFLERALHFLRERHGTPGTPILLASATRSRLGSTVAKLVEALVRCIPERTENAERKQEALRLGRELLSGSKYEDER
jgi:hypothetical protein